MKCDLANLSGKIIHCNAEEKANELLKLLDKQGYKWYSGDSLIDFNLNGWEYQGNKLCYILNLNKLITHSSIDYHSKYLEFEDIVE